jgi:hypothetical protein
MTTLTTSNGVFANTESWMHYDGLLNDQTILN